MLLTAPTDDAAHTPSLDRAVLVVHGELAALNIVSILSSEIVWKYQHPDASGRQPCPGA